MTFVARQKGKTMNDLISRQDAINKFEPWLKVEGYSEGELNMLKAILYELTVMPSAQPDLLDDGTLMVTVPQGMLEKVKRVMVDEFSTKFCKVMYQDEPERKKGRWIDQDDGAYYPFECSECHKEPLLDAYGNYVFSNFCPDCGSYNGGEEE